MPTERPILFSAPMVKALLAGTKTQTRRLVKHATGAFWDHAGYRPDMVDGRIRWRWIAGEPLRSDMGDYGPSPRCPYGQPGDLLWVREAVTRSGGLVQYVADGHTSRSLTWPAHWTRDPQNARFMPKRFARLWLEIVAVRCERLQEISEEDAKAEGVDPYIPGMGPISREELASDPGCRTERMYRDGFRYAWSELHDKPAGFGESWKANDWVWPITFRRTEAPQKEAA